MNCPYQGRGSMLSDQSSTWIDASTSTHQDHVIAHVIGATVVGYFILDETVYLLLDIGFVWHIYLNGEMGLVPHPVMLAELDIDDPGKEQLRSDIDALLSSERTISLKRMTANWLQSPIEQVVLKRNGDTLRVVSTCENGGLMVETSETKREVEVMEFEREFENETGLSKVAREEREFVRQQLSGELGREPTADEVDEWVREHTESY